jgi:hypothetical protein|uniref:Uncharacterized protein n=1 Tax=viral metagenome TaxID=1070528 RepID=A0A6C0CXA1_9ZZZZ
MESIYLIIVVLTLLYCLSKYLNYIYLLNMDTISCMILILGLFICFVKNIYYLILINEGYEPIYKDCIWSMNNEYNFEDCIDYFAKT